MWCDAYNTLFIYTYMCVVYIWIICIYNFYICAQILVYMFLYIYVNLVLNTSWDVIAHIGIPRFISPFQLPTPISYRCQYGSKYLSTTCMRPELSNMQMTPTIAYISGFELAGGTSRLIFFLKCPCIYTLTNIYTSIIYTYERNYPIIVYTYKWACWSDLISHLHFY